MLIGETSEALGSERIATITTIVVRPNSPRVASQGHTIGALGNGAVSVEISSVTGSSIGVSEATGRPLRFSLSRASALIASEVPDSGRWFGFLARQLRTRF